MEDTDESLIFFLWSGGGGGGGRGCWEVEVCRVKEGVQERRIQLLSIDVITVLEAILTSRQKTSLNNIRFPCKYCYFKTRVSTCEDNFQKCNKVYFSVLFEHIQQLKYYQIGS